jgi:hypothetical protein
MQNITGRDGFILAQALALAVTALERVPEDRRPFSNMADMIKLFEHLEPDDGSRALFLDEAETMLTGAPRSQSAVWNLVNPKPRRESEGEGDGRSLAKD